METIGSWEVLGELGRGGMGQVLRGRDPRSGQQVAIKLLRSGSEQQRGRFRREVDALLRLRHPGIVGFRSAGEHRGAPYLVMDLVEGASLQELLDRQGAFAAADAASIMAAVARALQHAHDQGVLHRDLKPGNVRLDLAGHPLLVDFGLARDADAGGSSLTRDGLFLGTPGYWPPEQARGERSRIGPVSDVYALGATLFALLTGRPPFLIQTMEDAVHAAQSEPPRPSSLVPGVDPALDALVLRCLAREPGARPASARAVAEALERWLAGDLRSPSGRGTVLAAAAIVGAGALLALGLLLSRPPGPPMPPPAPPTPAPSPPAPAPASPGSPAWSVAAGPRWALWDASDRLLAHGDVTPAVPPFDKPGPWLVEAHALGDLDGDGRRDLIVLARHERLFPALVLAVDPTGRELGRLEHPGHLRALLLLDQDGDGDDELFVGGLDNRLPAAVVVRALDLEGGPLQELGCARLFEGVPTDGSEGVAGLSGAGHELLAWTQQGNMRRVPLPLLGDPGPLEPQAQLRPTPDGVEIVVRSGQVLSARLPAPIRGWLPTQSDADPDLERLVIDRTGQGSFLDRTRTVKPLIATLRSLHAADAEDLEADGRQELLLAGERDPGEWELICQDPAGDEVRWRRAGRGAPPQALRRVGHGLELTTPDGVWRLALADGAPVHAGGCLALELPPGAGPWELSAVETGGGERRAAPADGPPCLPLPAGIWRVTAACGGPPLERTVELQPGQTVLLRPR